MFARDDRLPSNLVYEAGEGSQSADLLPNTTTSSDKATSTRKVLRMGRARHVRVRTEYATYIHARTKKNERKHYQKKPNVPAAGLPNLFSGLHPELSQKTSRNMAWTTCGP